MIKIINTLNKEDIVYLINNDYIKDIYWLKNINNEIKKEIILENNIPFKFKVKLTNYMEGNKL